MKWIAIMVATWLIPALLRAREHSVTTTTRANSQGACELTLGERLARDYEKHTFTGTDGAAPQAHLIMDSAGNLYGGAGGATIPEGVVFKLDPSGNETALYNFTGGAGWGSSFRRSGSR